MKTKLPHLKKNGFSLIEIILVVVIVGFIILLIANIPSAVNLIGSSRYSSIAKEIAERRIEYLRSQTYDNLANGSISIPDPRLSLLPTSSATATIEDCITPICSPTEFAKKVTVTIKWFEAGKQKEVSLTTLISQGGLN